MCGDTLWAAAFDPSSLQALGDAMPVMRGVSMTTVGASQFDVGDDGTLAYVPGTARGGQVSRLVWVTDSGRQEPLDMVPARYVSWGGCKANGRTAPCEAAVSTDWVRVPTPIRLGERSRALR